MTPRDEARLRDLHPLLAQKVARLLVAVDALGYPMTIVQGRRTTEEQVALYEQGRTKPGAIVTNADGVVKKSKHQSGRAVDCAFLRDGQVSWSEALPWRMYAEMGKALGLIAGADFKSIVDRPHLELPPEIP